MKKLLLTLLLIGWSTGAWATTDTFQEGVSGYSGSKLAYINSASTNEHINSIGAGYIVWRNGSDRPGIVYFPVTTIPTNATVSSATMTFKMDEANCTAETLQITKIADPSASGAWSMAATETDTFNHNATWRYKNEDTTTRWQTGGANSNFLDVNTGSVESTVAIGACPGSSSKSFSVTTMVQDWVTNPSTNAGAFLSCADNSCTIPTLNTFNSTTGNRPLLSVTYTVPASSHTNTINNSTIRNATIN